MTAFKDLTGQIFGNLKVIKFSRFLKKGKDRKRSYFICECLCGNITELCSRQLISKNKTNCGCIKMGNWKGCGQLSGSFYNTLKYNAQKRKLPLKVDVDQLWCLFLEQKGKCALTGLNINIHPHWNNRLFDPNKNTASLDRIDSKKGYVLDNIQWVHKIINFMKQDLSDKDFILWCNKVIQFNQEKINCENNIST